MKLDPPNGALRALGNLTCVPAPSGPEKRVHRDKLPAHPPSGRSLWARHLAEHLERNRKVVRSKYPHRVLIVSVARLDTNRTQPVNLTQPSGVGNIRKRTDSG